MQITYILFAIFFIFVGVFYLSTKNKIHHVNDHWVTYGNGFYYNLNTASEMDWYDLEKKAKLCSNQDKRVLSVPTEIADPGEFNSIWGKPVGKKLYREAVIIYSKGEPTLLVVNWETTPALHRQILKEALEERGEK